MERLAEGFRSALTKDGGVILDVQNGQMLRVNRIGAQILEALKQETSPHEIADEIARTYGISGDRAKADLREFLDSLRERHLLQSSESGEQP